MTEESGAVPAGPRVIMRKHETQHSENFVYFEAPPGAVQEDRTDGYYMTHAMWDSLGQPTEIEVRLEINSYEQ